MNDPAMKLAEEAIRIGAQLLDQRDRLQALLDAQCERCDVLHTRCTQLEQERDEYRRALDDAQKKYDNAMKVVTK